MDPDGNVISATRLAIAQNIGEHGFLSCQIFLTLPIRYICSLAVADYSSQAWLQGFNDAGVIIFGRTANDMIALRVRPDKLHVAIARHVPCRTAMKRNINMQFGKPPAKLTCLRAVPRWTRTMFDFYFTMVRILNMLQDQSRVRYAINKVQPLDLNVECRNMLDALSQYH